MLDMKKLPIVLATTAVVLAATLAIAGSSSDRLKREAESKGPQPFASPSYVQGLRTSQFKVTVQTLRAWMSGPTPPVLVDVRDAEPYEAGHLPNAILRPTSDLLSGKRTLEKGHQVVIYDQDGRLAPLLIHPLRARGIDAYMLAGGYAAWVSPHAPRPGIRTESGAEATSAAPCASPTATAVSAAPAVPVAPPPVAAPPAPAPPPAAGGKTPNAGKPPVDEGC